MNIRDHDKDRYEWRKEEVASNIEKLKKLHPKAEISYKISDTYENIANNVTKEDKPVALIYKALMS